MFAISTQGLCKSYGDKQVVRDVNIAIPEGAIYGFIGRNGAGKTTTQKMICGLTNASNGEIKIFDQPVSDSAVRRQIGMLIEQPAFYPTLSVKRNLILQGYNIGVSNPLQAAQKALREVGLEAAINKKAKYLSLGMKQRLALAMALMGSPKLLILDEPINGLDPEGIVEFRTILEKLNKEQHITIFISSHILGELDKIATHYGIIKDGELIEQITMEEMLKQRQSYMCVKVKNAKKAESVLKEELPIKDITYTSENELNILEYADTKAVNKALYSNGFDIIEIFVHQQDIEEYFLQLMGGKTE